MLAPRTVVGIVVVAVCGSLCVEAAQKRRSKGQPANRAVRATQHAPKIATKDTPDILQKLAVESARERAEYEKRASGLHLFPRSGLDEVSQKTHRKVSEILEQRNFIPQARLTHFQWIAARRLPTKGWGGQIEEVMPISNGFKVKLSVTPTSGSGLQYADRVSEYYTIVKDQVQFLGLEPGSPEGMRYNMTIQ